MSGNDRVPGNNIWLGNIVERLSGRGDAAAFGVHADQRGRHEEVGVEAVANGVGVDLATENEGLEVGGRFEEEGEGEAVGGDGAEAHARVEEEGAVRGDVGVG